MILSKVIKLGQNFLFCLSKNKDNGVLLDSVSTRCPWLKKSRTAAMHTLRFGSGQGPKHIANAEADRMQLVLFGMQNRIFGPYLESGRAPSTSTPRASEHRWLRRRLKTPKL
jgi:hypothetical protein